MKNNIRQIDALKTIYGIELDPMNANECRARLSLGSKDKEIWTVLKHNIVCANALDANHNGWNDVGYMWEGKKPDQQFLVFE
jgi:hypothetical protein